MLTWISSGSLLSFPPLSDMSASDLPCKDIIDSPVVEEKPVDNNGVAQNSPSATRKFLTSRKRYLSAYFTIAAAAFGMIRYVHWVFHHHEAHSPDLLATK